MKIDDMGRRLTGAFRNAVVWGAAWFTLGAVVTAVIRLADGISPPIALADGIFMGTKIGVMGGVVGGAFSVFLSLFYRGRRLSELRALRFGIGGGIMAGMFVTGILLTGGGLAVLPFIIEDALMAAVFGGLTAGGSVKLAQRAESLPIRDSLGRLDGAEPVAAPRVVRERVVNE